MKAIRILAAVVFLGSFGYFAVSVLRPFGSGATQRPPLREPERREFTSISQAAQYAGFDIPQPREPGWSLKGKVRFTRAVGLLSTATWVEASYERGGATVGVTVLRPEGRPADIGGIPEPTLIQGVNGQITRSRVNPDLIQVNWNRDGMTLEASTYLSQISLDDFLRVVESIR